MSVNPATISVRIKHKNLQQTAGQRRHDQRIGNMPKYVDSSRSGDNSVVIPAPSESSVKKRCNELRDLQPHERAAKHTAAISTAGIITFSHEAQIIIRALSVEDQDAMYRDVAERIAARLDTDLISLSVHRDESAPHAHFSMIAVNKQGIPISKAVHVSGMRELQDIAGQVMKDRGLPITRGKPKSQRIADGEPKSKWMNRSVKQLYEDIPAEIDEILDRKRSIEKELDDADKKLANNSRLVAKSQSDLDAGNGDVEKLKKRIATYTNRIATQESSIAALQQEQSALDKEIAEKRKRVESAHEKMPAPAGFRIPVLDVAVLTDPDAYADTVAEYVAEEARKATDRAMAAERVKLDKREADMDKRDRDLKSREKAVSAQEITSEKYRDLYGKYNLIKNDRDSILRKVGTIMGVENAALKISKIADAIDKMKTLSMDEFRKTLADAGLTGNNVRKSRIEIC